MPRAVLSCGAAAGEAIELGSSFFEFEFAVPGDGVCRHTEHELEPTEDFYTGVSEGEGDAGVGCAYREFRLHGPDGHCNTRCATRWDGRVLHITGHLGPWRWNTTADVPRWEQSCWATVPADIDEVPIRVNGGPAVYTDGAAPVPFR